jgi:hypothetical protein
MPKQKPDDRIPLGELIDRMRDGVEEAFVQSGYADVAFVLVAQDAETGFGGMAANHADEGAKVLLGTALDQLAKGRKRIVQ